MAIMPSFISGGNTGLTPEQIARQRQIAQAMLERGGDTSPITHWTQGAARVAQALVGGLLDRKANNDYRAGQEGFSKRFGALLGGGEMPSIVGNSAAWLPAPPTGKPGQTYSGPKGVSGLNPKAQYAYANAQSKYAPEELRDGISATARSLGISPTDLATVISYETAGTFDPVKAGPTTQWGQHKGLIQFGEPQAKEYGVDWNNPLGSQLGADGAVAKYLRATGVKPGMGLMDVYSAINAGGVGRYNASDAKNGGAPGTVADKVNNQMADHRAKAMAMFGQQPVQVASADPGFAPQITPASAPPDNIPLPMEVLAPQQPQIAPQGPQVPQPQSAPMKVAQATIGQQQGGFDPGVAAIIEMMNDPYASNAQKQILGIMLERKMADPAEGQMKQLQLQKLQADANAGPLDLEGKRLANQKLQRELENEGATPLTAEERAQFGIPADQPVYKTGKGEIKFGPSGTKTTINTGAAPSKSVFDEVSARAEPARAAANALPAFEQAEAAIQSGAILGAGADLRLGLAKIGTIFGMDPNAAENTETFSAVMAPTVLALVKGLGAGTSISNADREFAEKAAAGKTTLEEGTIRRLISIGTKAARARIDSHNKIIDQVYPESDPQNAQVRALFRVTAPPPKDDQPSQGAPQGIDPAVWQYMTPEERALWK